MPRSLAPIVRRVVVLSLAAACSHSHAPPAPTAAAVPTPAPPPPPAVVQLRAMRANGAVLTYRILGDQGTPVVFVHGSYGDLDDWSAQVAAFARTHRVFVYSRRYHPPNPPQDDGQVYAPELHAEDLAALLPVLRLAPAQVVGSGYGAYVALALAQEHPDLVRTLVLDEPPVLPFLLRSPAGDSLRRAFLASTLGPARAAFARGDSVAALRLFIDGTTDRPGTFDNLSAAARARVVAHSFEMRREMLADRQQYLPALDCAALARLAMPVLLIQGDRSPRMYHIITAELARCIQSDTVITIPGAGHRKSATNPGAYNETVLRYLDTH
jgi:pimeloyl-ACP methyl ester carboxylesterase